MNTLNKNLATLLTMVFFNVSQTPGIADNQVHAEFVISKSDVSSWKSVVILNSFYGKVQNVGQ